MSIESFGMNLWEFVSDQTKNCKSIIVEKTCGWFISHAIEEDTRIVTFKLRSFVCICN